MLLHGGGEIGSDNRAQLTSLALTWARDDRRRRYEAFVVVPQLPRTAFSMGASTAWNLIHDRPDFFSAAVPIAGVPRADQASVRTATRIWAIHGNRDENVPIRHDRRAFVPLVDAGARIRFSEIDHLGHEVPPTLLASEELARFLLGQP